MAIFSASRGLCRRLAGLLSPAVSIPSSTSSSIPRLSFSTSKSHPYKLQGPNNTSPITSSVPKIYSFSTSGGGAVDIASRRLDCVESGDAFPTKSMESVLSKAILYYGTFNTLDEAIAVFETIPSICRAPATTLSFNALLTSAIRAGEHNQVPHLFSLQSQKSSISPDGHSYAILVEALCLAGKLDSALATIDEMEKKGIEATTAIYTTIIHFLYKKGEAERAEELWNEMIEKGRDPDLKAYNVKIFHRAFHGKLEEVIEIISELKAAGLKPDIDSYNCLMSCCSAKGSYEDVNQVYEEMKSGGCAPTSITYGIMVDRLCENGDFAAGLKVFMESMFRDQIPGVETVRRLAVGLANESMLEGVRTVVLAMRHRRYSDEWNNVEKELGLDLDSLIFSP